MNEENTADWASCYDTLRFKMHLHKLLLLYWLQWQPASHRDWVPGPALRSSLCRNVLLTNLPKNASRCEFCVCCFCFLLAVVVVVVVVVIVVDISKSLGIFSKVQQFVHVDATGINIAKFVT